MISDALAGNLILHDCQYVQSLSQRAVLRHQSWINVIVVAMALTTQQTASLWMTYSCFRWPGACINDVAATKVNLGSSIALGARCLRYKHKIEVRPFQSIWDIL